MTVGGSPQETLEPGFVLHGTRQQGVPVILRELVLPGGFDPVSITEESIIIFSFVLIYLFTPVTPHGEA
ncbi:unnamed protein product [Schistosoma curassoni]|uniref:Uncharacterized protein n=1 Tax=Schistosoma curassoni TaxID=6186 RepID=A0A183KFW1_9TREM|nr:unnamed protein product [Schistosoma curassoni]